MNKMRYVRSGALVAFVALICSVTQGQSLDWIDAAKTMDGKIKIQVRPSSIEFRDVAGVGPVVTGFMRRIEDGRIYLNRAYISWEDCHRTYGKLVLADMELVPQSAADYAINSGSMASDVAEGLCVFLKSFETKRGRDQGSERPR